VSPIKPTRKHPHFAGRKSQPISADYDALLIATAHDEYRTTDFSGFDISVVDTRNCIRARPVNLVQA
jgi:UDP-N-acetyl-D-glucosamine dehydrogenase